MDSRSLPGGFCVGKAVLLPLRLWSGLRLSGSQGTAATARWIVRSTDFHSEFREKAGDCMHTLVRGALLIGACAGAYIVYKKLTEEQQPASKRAEPEKPKSSDMGCFQSKKDDIPAEQ
eukprot:2302403-Rhodomonas_salina.1